MTLTVVRVASTGHVVGLLTGTGLPADPALGALVGRDRLVLHARSSDTTMVELPLAVAALEIATVPAPRPGQVDPLAYGLDQTGKVLSALARWDVESPVSLQKGKATVKVKTPPQADAAIVLVLDNGRTALSGTLGASQSSVDLPILPQLDPGPHGWLLLVAGWAGRTGSGTVS